jgi:hypothetical protein
METWEDEISMLVLNGNQFSAECEEEKRSKANKHITKTMTI